MPSPESDPVTTPSPAPRVGTGVCALCGARPDPDRALEIGDRHADQDPAQRRGLDRVLVAMVAAFLVSLTLILIGCWQVAQWVLG